MPIYVPSQKNLEDRSLVRTRKIIVKDQTRFKNRIKSFLYFHGVEIPETYKKPKTHWSKRFMNWLSEIELSEVSAKLSLMVLIEEANHLRGSLLRITQQIRALSRTESYQENVKLLLTVPGIALITAMTILTEIESISRFENIDQFCGYVGLIPSTKSSGEKEKVGDITPRGHFVLRPAIVESAWNAVRKDPALLKYYNECCKRMMPNRAIIRISKKLLSRIQYVLKNKQPYVCSIN